MSNVDEGVICYREIDKEHTLEIRVYEDNEEPDCYYVQVTPEWDCELEMVDFGIGAYSDESLTIEEVEDWLDDFWGGGTPDNIIDACKREEYKYLEQLREGYKGIKFHEYSYIMEQGSQEFVVWECTITLTTGESKTFKGSDRYEDGNWAEIRSLEKAWDWIENMK